MGSTFRAALRLGCYLAWTLLLIPVQIVAVALDRPLARRLPVFYHRNCLRLIGLHPVVRGTIAAPPPVLLVSNHTSYLDIAVLAALVPVSFVAKREVANWPLFGLLAKLQRTVFIDRTARRDVHGQKSEIAARLSNGENRVLLPEGTSDDGARILPFKSALFSAAEEHIDGRLPVVQPVSIAYTRLDGMPLGRALRPFYAWYGDMAMFPHLWRLLGLGVGTVEIEFHAPVTAGEFPSRRALADHCRRVVADGVAAALAGRGADLHLAERPADSPESSDSGPVAEPGRP